MTRTNSGPFQAMQDMFLYDPMTGAPRPEANPRLLEVSQRIRAEKEMLGKLEALRLQRVTANPEWEKCLHVEFEPGKFHHTLIMDLLAGSLVHKCLFPLEMARTEDTIWVRTG